MEFGVKAKPLFAPTMTVWTPDAEDAVVEAGAFAAEEAVELDFEPPAGGPY